MWREFGYTWLALKTRVVEMILPCFLKQRAKFTRACCWRSVQCLAKRAATKNFAANCSSIIIDEQSKLCGMTSLVMSLLRVIQITFDSESGFELPDQISNDRIRHKN